MRIRKYKLKPEKNINQIKLDINQKVEQEEKITKDSGGFSVP